MAGIDKMNMTKEQFYKFCEWFFEHYSVNEEGKEIMEQMNYQNVMEYDRVTFNFPKNVDEYLKKNCGLDFVQKRLKEQYGE
jgi:hypothetical protein